jgi:MYXO-CTERM domain-containing protein
VHLYGAHPAIASVVGTAERLEVTVANTGYGPLMAGNVTIAGAAAALPMIPVNGTTTVVLEGSFAAGSDRLAIDWQKRIHKAPWEERSFGLELREEAGGLVGVVDRRPGSAGEPLNAPAEVSTPAPMVGLLVVAVLAAAFVASRRRQT